MKKWKKFFVLIMAIVYFPMAFSQSPTGLWTTVDDKTGKKRALVRIQTTNGVLSGKILKVYNKEPDDTGRCSKCPGDFKNKPIKGLQFLWGLKKQGDGSWSGGQILDPKTGKIYRAKLSLKGNKLFVRGYVGFSMLGRTQVWIRK